LYLRVSGEGTKVRRRILQKLRENGIGPYLKWKYLKKMLRNARPKYQKLVVFEQSLAEPLHSSNLQIDAEFKIGKNMNEIKTLIEQREHWYPSLAEKRFDDENICFVAEHEKKIICCVWTSFKDIYLPNVEYTLEVEKEVAPLIDGWTSLDFRGMGVYNFVWNNTLRYLREHSEYKKIYGFIQPTNKLSLMVHRRMNLEKVIVIITLIKIFGIRFHRVKYLSHESIKEFADI